MTAEWLHVLPAGGSWFLNVRLSKARSFISATCATNQYDLQPAFQISTRKKTPTGRETISTGPKGSKRHLLFVPKGFVDAVFPTQTFTSLFEQAGAEEW